MCVSVSASVWVCSHVQVSKEWICPFAVYFLSISVSKWMCAKLCIILGVWVDNHQRKVYLNGHQMRKINKTKIIFDNQVS